MKLEQHLQYLVEIGSSDASHSKRSLHDHLVGTYNILKSWGNQEYVCLAGLFHSVYSTKNYMTALLSHENRYDVIQRIGPKAELLVFFFSFLAIENLKDATKNGNKVSVFLDQLEIELTALQYTQLVEITLANFIEQIPYLANEKDINYDKYRSGWGWIKGIASKKAVHLFREHGMV